MSCNTLNLTNSQSETFDHQCSPQAIVSLPVHVTKSRLWTQTFHRDLLRICLPPQSSWPWCEMRLSSIPQIQCHWVIDIAHGSQTSEFPKKWMLLVEDWVSPTTERICHATCKPTLREEFDWCFANCSPTKSPTIFSIIDTTWLGSVKRAGNRIKFDQRSIWMRFGKYKAHERFSDDRAQPQTTS